MIPICILPDSPVIKMIIGSANHNSQKMFELDQPQFRMKNSISPHIILRRRYHSHIPNTFIPPNNFALLAAFVVSVENKKRDATFTNRIEYLHFEPIVCYHYRFNLFTYRMHGHCFEGRLEEIWKRYTVDSLSLWSAVID